MAIKISTAITIFALATAVVLPPATSVWVTHERIAAEEKYAQFQAKLDAEGVIERDLMINGKKFYEKCVSGWCLTSASKEDLEDFNGLTPSKLDIGKTSRGGGVPVLDPSIIEALKLGDNK